MKRIVFCLLFFITLSSFGQKQFVYFPDGTAYKGSDNTLEAISNELESQNRVYHYKPFVAYGDEFTTVGFVLFTDSALWVMTKSPSQIDSAIRSFNKKKFFASQEFIIELEAFIAKGALDKSFVLATLGEPTRKRTFQSKQGMFDRWEYHPHAIDLILEGDLVTHYIRRKQ